MMIEKDNVIPSTGGTPSKYTVKFVFANRKYFVHANLLASSIVTVFPVKRRNNDNPMASELFRNTVEIINAIVATNNTSIELNKY